MKKTDTDEQERLRLARDRKDLEVAGERPGLDLSNPSEPGQLQIGRWNHLELRLHGDVRVGPVATVEIEANAGVRVDVHGNPDASKLVLDEVRDLRIAGSRYADPDVEARSSVVGRIFFRCGRGHGMNGQGCDGEQKSES
jgi:hypothetical protein